MNNNFKKAIFGLKFALCCIFVICLISFSSVKTKAIEGENQEEVVCEHVEEILQGKPSTCVEKGLSTGVKCSVCDEILLAQEELPLGEHQYGEWEIVKEATEEEKGLRKKKCINCDEVVEEEFDYTPIEDNTPIEREEDPTPNEDEEEKYDIDKITSYIISLLISFLGSGSFWILFKGICSKWANKKDELLQSKLTELENANIISTEQKELIVNKFNDLTNNFNELTKQFEDVMQKNTELTEYIKSKIDLDEERKQQINELLNKLLPDIIDNKGE